MVEKGCSTCIHFSDFTGKCSENIADEFQARDGDTSSCTKYEYDDFYNRLLEKQ